jgi:hypothetical protein
VSALERRYRALLRAYPRAYRAERGDEIVGTLLDDSRPDQQWPSRRDVGALVLGGLRQRTGADRLPPGAALRDGLYLALIMILTGDAVAVFPVRLATVHVSVHSVALTAVAALAALLVRWRAIGLVLVVLTSVQAWLGTYPGLRAERAASEAPTLAVVAVFAIVAWRARRAGRAPVRLPAPLVVAAVVLAAALQRAQVADPFQDRWKPFVLLAVPVVAAVLAAVVDPRLLVAAPVAVLSDALTRTYDLASFGSLREHWLMPIVWFSATEAALVLVLLPLGLIVGWRRARI